MIYRLDDHQDQAGAWDVLLEAKGQIAWDIGANIGQSTKVLAEGFEYVMAFEPCAESAAILRAEAPDNVEVFEWAVSDTTGEIQLEEADRSIRTGQLVTGVGLPIWGERIGLRTVPSIALDDHVGFGPAGLPRPDFIKVDTEGHEVQVVRGGVQSFAGCPNVIIEIHRAENEAPIREMLPMFEWKILRHGDYVAKDGPLWTHHYWMVGENKKVA